MENHPVLFASSSIIAASTITAMINAVIKNKKSITALSLESILEGTILSEEVKGVLSELLETKNQRLQKKLGKYFYQIAYPLERGIIDEYVLGNKSKMIKVDIDQKAYFHSEEYSDKMHKIIELTGSIRNPDKKTNNGKFIDSENNTYYFLSNYG